jgi:hypothetical protein
MGDMVMDSENAWATIREHPEREGEILGLWAAWLYETHGEGLPVEVLHLIYSKAWEDGHSAGLHEIEMYFVELVEFAEKVRAAR